MSRSTKLSLSLIAAAAAFSATAVAAPNPRVNVLDFAPPPAAQPTPDTTVPPAADATPVQTTDDTDTATDTTTTDKAKPADDQKKVALLDLPHGEELHADTLTHTPVGKHAAPRFEIAGGFFVQQRGMEFDYDPYADGAPPEYPASNVKGFALSAAIFPLPVEKYGSRLSGLGFAVKVAKSAGSTLVASDDTGTGEYEVDHSAWEGAVHYRYPIDRIAIDGEVAFGNWTHNIIDLPESIEIPDTSYQYLSAGAHLDVYPTERASIGFGAKYLNIMSSGDVTSQDWYGAGSASGVVLDASLQIPLPLDLFLRGGLEYRRITVEVDGSGDLADEWGVGTITDTSLTGTAQVGVQF